MKAQTFQELENLLNQGEKKMTAKEFAEWLDEHGYKTFPDALPYTE